MTTEKDYQHVLFEKKKKSLQSATSFVQYMVNISKTNEVERFRLITLIGEFHDTDFTCGKPSISIEEYVINYIKRDSKTMVLLEMDNNQYAEHKYPQSVPIRSILENTEVHQYLKYYDPRNSFLPKQDRYRLYDSSINLEKDKSCKDLWDLYGKPFKKMWSQLSEQELKKHSYNKKNLTFLRKSLYKDISDSFKDVENNLDNCVYKLRICWLKVTDWFIMSKILADSEENTAIAIMGEYHLEHITEQIINNNMSIRINQRNKESKNCVSLFETCYIALFKDN